MAVSGKVSLEVVARAQENVRAVLKQSNAAIRKSADELRKAGVAQTKMGAAVAKAIRGQGRFRSAMIASADRVSNFGSKLMNVKAAMGALAAAMAIRQLKDFTIAGEKAANIAQRFAASTKGSADALAGMQRATAGIVEATDLQVVANRFARLGVPVRDVTRLLELATKAAIDQGREVLDVARVIESSLKGRTTGLIDIGVNIDKITGLTQEYAAATGVSVGELDEMDRRLKVALPAALRALGEQFDAVDVEEFTLRMQRANTAVGDLVSDWQMGAAEIFASAVEAFQPAEKTIGELVVAFGRQSKVTAEVVDWTRKNRDSTVLMWMAQGDLEESTGRLSEATFALRNKLREMPLEERASAFESLEASMALMTDEAREQARALFHLEAEYRGVEKAADAAKVATGGFAMAPGVSRMEEDLQRIGEEYDKLNRADKKRRAAAWRAAREAAARAAARDAANKKAAAERMQEQIAQQDAANKIARVEGDRAKLFFGRLEKERQIKRASLDIDDEALRAQFEAVKMAGLDLETAAALHEINEAERATDDKRLQIARDKAQERAREADERRDALATMVGGDLGEVAGMFADLDASLESLGRPARYTQISKGFAALSAQTNKIAKTTADFAGAVGKGNKAVAEGAAAALGAIAPAVAGFVEGTKERALIMMAFELAMAVAEGAAQNWPAAVGHGIAAGMFGAMAGVAASQPTTAASREVAGGGGLITPSAPAPSEQEAQRITVNLGAGTIFGMPQEMGRAIADRISSMAGSGMESTAF